MILRPLKKIILLLVLVGLQTAVSHHTLAKTNGPYTTHLPFITYNPHIRFAVIGDYGDGSANETAVANMVKSWQPQFIITVGDNNYPIGAAAAFANNVGRDYGQYVFSQPTRFFPALGNHDWDTDNAQPYFNYFPINTSPAYSGNSKHERYYDFVQTPVHFYALDSDPREPSGTDNNSAQAVWLQNRLATSPSPWQIVYFHHPAYSSSPRHGSSLWMRWPFEIWGADAVLGGHNHIYERLLIGNIPYFVNGLGGHSKHADGVVPLTGSQIRYNDEFGAMLVEADAHKITFQFFAIPGILIDSYTITQP